MSGTINIRTNTGAVKTTFKPGMPTDRNGNQIYTFGNATRGNDPLVCESEKVLANFLSSLSNDETFWNLLEQHRILSLSGQSGSYNIHKKIQAHIEKEFLKFINTNKKNSVGKEFLSELLKTDLIFASSDAPMGYIRKGIAFSLTENSIRNYTKYYNDMSLHAPRYPQHYQDILERLEKNSPLNAL